ncbi:MAG: aldehyde ferredoxin oxidoreductase C-terminal domain-containing protein, partial [SAR324 cluster bacterium]|nr:aldehyde ferredoxin oxidoreductase C-terminal domain-containing protein [SAR324 cluster bacterium]
KNSQKTAFGDGAEPTSGEYVKENILVGDPTCHACPTACMKEVVVKEGPWKGLRMESLEYDLPGHLEPTAETVMSMPSPN